MDALARELMRTLSRTMKGKVMNGQRRRVVDADILGGDSARRWARCVAGVEAGAARATLVAVLALLFAVALPSLDVGAQDGDEDAQDGIYIVNADGSGLVPLATGVVSGSRPAWSPDGTKLAVVVAGGIEIVNADGSGRTPLADGGPAVAEPAWSPDGARIAFTDVEQQVLMVVATDGSGTTSVPLLAPDACREMCALPADNRPAWSPDGARIAFVSWDGNGQEVFVVNADGSGRVQLTDIAAGDDRMDRLDPNSPRIAVADAQFPAWSPDGRTVAFALVPTTGAGGPGGVYVVGADGSGQRQLSDGAVFSGPRWSPDGTKLVFGDWQGERADVWVIGADGAGLTNLTNDHGGQAGDPAWSPDGARLAFASEGDIWVMNADGSGKRVVSGPDLDDASPAWSPDATKIAFVCMVPRPYVD
jgi:TolB protein